MSTSQLRRDDALDGLLAVLPEAILLVRADGRIEAANSAAEALLEVGPDGLTGRSLLALASRDEGDVMSYLRACARTRAMLPGALTITGSDGRPLRLRGEGGRVQADGASGPPLVLLRFARLETAVARFSALNLRIEELNAEIGRRRFAEQALRDSSELLRVTLASIGDAVITTDAGGRITFINSVAESLTGWTQEQAAGRLLHEVFVIVNETTRQTVESPVARVLRENVVVGLANHTVLLSRDGRERPIDDSGAPILDDRGRVLGVVLIFRDITERRALERDRAEADRRKDEFLAMLAHELRNPLAAIASGAELVRRQAPTSLAAASETIHRQVHHLARLVDDLLDVSRIASGKISLRRERVPLRRVIEDALAAHYPTIEARRIGLDVRMPGEPAWIDGDAARLSQVLGNLIANAVKFSAEGGRVRLAGEVREGWVSVEVADEGEGIAPELLPQIFELFVQADTSPARARGGLGIGLTVAKLITEMHGGRLDAKSEGPGRGAEFTIHLPLVSGVDTATSEEAPARLTGGRRILVVDDNLDAAESLAALLRLVGHDVRTAGNGESALRLQQESPAEVLLLDLGMPGMDGYQLAERLRALRDQPRPRLIALTGYGGEADRHRAAAAGFDAHLTKPADLRDLERLMR